MLMLFLGCLYATSDIPIGLQVPTTRCNMLPPIWGSLLHLTASVPDDVTARSPHGLFLICRTNICTPLKMLQKGRAENAGVRCKEQVLPCRTFPQVLTSVNADSRYGS